MRTIITGGTGSLGNALVTELLQKERPQDITVFSRDEQKHVAMKRFLPDLRYELGDVRDFARVSEVMKGHDVVFHCAAIKHVDLCEVMTGEAIKTNIVGSMNVADAAKAACVRYCALSSTDKAVLPINHYGYCKGAAEKYFYSMNGGLTSFSVFRWGNVLGSNGSVIKIFADQLKRGNKITVTHPEMSRFWIRIEDAAKYMVSAYNVAPETRPCIPHMKAARLMDIVDAVTEVLDISGYNIKYTGIRPGEKLHEVIESTHKYCIRSDTCEQYSHEELVELVRGCLG